MTNNSTNSIIQNVAFTSICDENLFNFFFSLQNIHKPANFHENHIS